MCEYYLYNIFISHNILFEWAGLNEKSRFGFKTIFNFLNSKYIRSIWSKKLKTWDYGRDKRKFDLRPEREGPGCPFGRQRVDPNPMGLPKKQPPLASLPLTGPLSLPLSFAKSRMVFHKIMYKQREKDRESLHYELLLVIHKHIFQLPIYLAKSTNYMFKLW